MLDRYTISTPHDQDPVTFATRALARARASSRWTCSHCGASYRPYDAAGNYRIVCPKCWFERPTSTSVTYAREHEIVTAMRTYSRDDLYAYAQNWDESDRDCAITWYRVIHVVGGVHVNALPLENKAKTVRTVYVNNNAPRTPETAKEYALIKYLFSAKLSEHRLAKSKESAERILASLKTTQPSQPLNPLNSQLSTLNPLNP